MSEPKFGTTIKDPSGKTYVYTSEGWAVLGGTGEARSQELEAISSAVRQLSAPKGYEVAGYEIRTDEQGNRYLVATYKPQEQLVEGLRRAHYRSEVERHIGMPIERLPPNVRQDIERKIDEAAREGKPLSLQIVTAQPSVTIPRREEVISATPEAQLLARDVPLPSMLGYVYDVFNPPKAEKLKFFSEMEEKVERINPIYRLGSEIQRRSQSLGEEASVLLYKIPVVGPVLGTAAEMVIAGTGKMAGSAVKTISTMYSVTPHERLYGGAAAVETIASVGEALAIGKAVSLASRGVAAAGGKVLERVEKIGPLQKVGEKISVGVTAVKAKVEELTTPRFTVEEKLVVSPPTTARVTSIEPGVTKTVSLTEVPKRPFAELSAVVKTPKTESGVSVVVKTPKTLEETPKVTLRYERPVERGFELEKASMVKQVEYKPNFIFTADEPFTAQIYLRGKYGRPISPLKRNVEYFAEISPKTTWEFLRVDKKWMSRVYTLPKEGGIDFALVGRGYKPLSKEKVFFRETETGTRPPKQKPLTQTFKETSKELERTVKELRETTKVKELRETTKLVDAGKSALLVDKEVLEGGSYRYIVPHWLIEERQVKSRTLTTLKDKKPAITTLKGKRPLSAVVQKTRASSVIPIPAFRSLEASFADVVAMEKVESTAREVTIEAQKIETIISEVPIRTETIISEVPIRVEPFPEPFPDLTPSFEVSGGGLARATVPMFGLPSGGIEREVRRWVKSWLRNEKRFLRELSSLF